ncbi:MAG TPA: HlyD family efflux transporter periplasmic adaptor subunit [Prolixibacteraceae bacterium]|nr:HlyD family efflux transporter periplasmic adaptor subunit [Prolixibacteraceae bacterium]
MSGLFPPEILKNSCENYFSEQHSSGRIIYLSVIIIIIISFSLLPLVHIQVTTQSEGVVRSGYEDNPVIPAVSGEVISCRISENQPVNKEDTLLIIASDRIIQEIRLLEYKLKDDNLLISDLNKLILGNRDSLQSALYRQDYISFSGKLAEQKTRMLQSEREFLLAETLFGKGITPKRDFETATNQYVSEKQRYFTIQALQLTLWQQKLKELNLGIIEHACRIKQLRHEKEQYCLKAPVSGTITDFSGIQTGNFLVSNQLIAKIAPENDLLVECFVSPSDIGLIENEMSATFQFHSFNYNLWGVATGCVKEVSSNVVHMGNRPFFRVRCRLDQDYLKLKCGTKGNIIKGMTLTGRFQVADRTLFQLLYDKADNWLNPKRKNG